MIEEAADMADVAEWLLDLLVLNSLEVRDSCGPSAVCREGVEFRGMIGRAAWFLGS